MSESKVDFTYYLRKALDFLLVNNPIGTAMGILAGFVLQWIFVVTARMLQGAAVLATNSSLLHTIPIGVLIFNFRYFLKSRSSDPRLSAVLHAIEEADKRAGFNEWERKRLYEKVVEKFIEGEDFSSFADRALK